jgi:hypothetical protein
MKKIMTTHQVKFSRHEFPFQNRKMFEQYLSDNATDFFFQTPFNVKWAPSYKLYVGNYHKVHHDKVCNVTALQVVTESTTFTSIVMSRCLTS